MAAVEARNNHGLNIVVRKAKRKVQSLEGYSIMKTIWMFKI